VEKQLQKTTSFTSAFVWTFLGSVTFAGSQWLMLILLAKLGDSKMVGQYGYAWAVAYPVSLLANLNLRSVYVNDHAGRFTFGYVLGLRYLLAALGIVVLAVCICLRHDTVAAAGVLLAIGGSALIDSISESHFGIFQKQDRMDLMSQSLILRSLLSMSLAGTILYFTRNLLYTVCGVLLGRLLTFLFFDSSRKSFAIARAESQTVESRGRSGLFFRLLPCWQKRTQLSLFWITLPLGIVNVLVTLNANVPRYVIESYLGSRDLGIYSAVGYIPQAGMLFSTTLGSISYSALNRFFVARQDRKFLGLLGKMILISVAIGLCALLVTVFAGRWLLTLLYRPEYAAHSDILIWLVITAGVAGVAACVGYAITAASQFRPQVPLLLLVNAVSAAVSFALVPAAGLRGAAIASLCAMLVQAAGSGVILFRALRNRSASELDRFSAVHAALRIQTDKL
jgi:O-antigen/teichoic acid export membrane protein